MNVSFGALELRWFRDQKHYWFWQGVSRKEQGSKLSVRMAIWAGEKAPVWDLLKFEI
jgi:hypothetical protein